MERRPGDNDWVATGIPITPINDAGHEDPYPLATITVVVRAEPRSRETQAVVPVSWEISCDLCHNTAGISTATDILRAHDRLHSTHLEQSKPVMCAQLPRRRGPRRRPGQPGVPNLSRAMHTAHAPRMAAVQP